MIAIHNLALHSAVGVTHNRNGNKAGAYRTDTVLERIFNQGNEKQRGNRQSIIRIRLQTHMQIYLLRQPDAHQGNIIAYEIKFLTERHIGLLIVIQHMPEQLAQLLHRLLCLVAVERNQGIDIIQRIQQKVRIQLIFQVLQFGFRLLLLSLHQLLFGLPPAQTGTDGSPQPGHEYHHAHIAQIENPAGRKMTDSIGRRRSGETFHQPVQQHTEANDSHRIDQHILPHFMTKQIAGHQPQVVQIENAEITSRYTAVEQEPHPVDITAPVDKDQRKTKDKQPADCVYAHLQTSAL